MARAKLTMGVTTSDFTSLIASPVANSWALTSCGVKSAPLVRSLAADCRAATAPAVKGQAEEVPLKKGK